MAIENEMHPIQVNILLVLLFRTKARFSELNTLKVPSDQFNFHLKKLVEAALIEKSGNLYRLMPKGKEFANRFDTQNLVPERQAKVAVLICCVKKEKTVNKYLVQKRLKQPYYGYYGFFGGKIRWGETVFETANRELKEETGLSGKLKLVGIKHKMDYSKDLKLLEDKFFFTFKVTNLTGKLIEKFEGGENVWLTEEEIYNLPNLFDGVNTTLEMVKGVGLSFIERKYKVKRY
ncbi:hypothetical protein A2865_00795 [Candidatus Woesebacteria bacterium RIFCSPHIGHO2_01_FULL_39_17]|uniref:NUDIX hydrolase n=4 Tax=Microgenomates group TaxID=1794810 RepID=A0A0G0NFZ0_9BACT|nr:putative NUDIX hydrolase [uncultured Microgenomates bacterium Rifle_16ft_4_minimus_954]KKQ51930.1 MAG: NUDIX hydrolase [Microgenomates group bacterium GW2011_GWC1_38_12]KKQ94406.1 MAG: NUDIX hydrolase [Candidatus Woesebacteria bacterium GW2011_GWB1_39_10b]KKR14418.1 MAG: NUDIX hydrolase [Candidatus Woesebacteria bacterium GW2011_GWA1_39_21b]OGM23785.1 MAG: hypothetical protein A2865_00795 [Candidatus Woesebacteria bacterium RIFCSPHIGHO2_01_FULL_39_17]OGM61209.1 MAG: hypothetical protein A3A